MLSESDSGSDESSLDSFSTYESDEYDENSVELNFPMFRGILQMKNARFALDDGEYDEDTGYHKFTISELQGGPYISLHIHLFDVEFYREGDTYRDIKVTECMVLSENGSDCDRVAYWLEECMSKHRTKKRTRLIKEELKERVPIGPGPTYKNL